MSYDQHDKLYRLMMFMIICKNLRVELTFSLRTSVNVHLCSYLNSYLELRTLGHLSQGYIVSVEVMFCHIINLQPTGSCSKLTILYSAMLIAKCL